MALRFNFAQQFAANVTQSGFANTYRLVQKYGGSVPRYTSYPPVPDWSGAPTDEHWFGDMGASTMGSTSGIAVYVHLPYCEQLCTYCACNKRITVNHAVEAPYINDLHTEWMRYREVLPQPVIISELHLGGGTPTFFSAENLGRMMEHLLRGAVMAEGASFSVEVHPNHTSREQLEVLYAQGFRRLSIGVQSLDLNVQQLINRVQPTMQVAKISDLAREIGFTSINYDAIYGLPHQTTEVVQRDIHELINLKPDRIAHYGYAHVPWKHAGQRRYTEADLPEQEDRFRSAELARAMFIDAGYVEIGMDHYALPHDSLAVAALEKRLHRNFMGYTDQEPELLIGLGASSISESPNGYVQNEKHIETYRKKLHEGTGTFVNGHLFTPEDHSMRRHIRELMCNLSTELPEDRKAHIIHLIDDGIVRVEGNRITVNEGFRPFLRSVCAALDPKEIIRLVGHQYSSNL